MLPAKLKKLQSRIADYLADNLKSSEEDMLRDLKISKDEWREAVRQDDFMDNIYRVGLKEIVAPRIPAMLGEMSQGAVKGDVTKQKLMLQVLGKLREEGPTQIQINATPDELRNRIDILKEEMDALTGGDIIEAHATNADRNGDAKGLSGMAGDPADELGETQKDAEN